MKKRNGLGGPGILLLFLPVLVWSCASGPEVNPTAQACMELLRQVETTLKTAEEAGAAVHTPHEFRWATQRLDFSRKLMAQGNYIEANASLQKTLDKARILNANALMEEAKYGAQEKEKEVLSAEEYLAELEAAYNALLAEEKKEGLNP